MNAVKQTCEVAMDLLGHILPEEQGQLAGVLQGILISEISSLGGPGALTLFCAGVALGGLLVWRLQGKKANKANAPKEHKCN